MPRIVLKPGSPEYADACEAPTHNKCDMPGCRDHATFKAPKNRGLNEYHNFCFEHVREYNKAWNFFEGMAESEVENHVYKSWYGDRPTWKYGMDSDSLEEEIHQKVHNTYRYGPEQSSEKSTKSGNGGFYAHRGSAEFEALAMMGLYPPVTLDDIRMRYKQLVKQHHPDLNAGCKESEERLKQINMAYTVLKVACENFQALPDNA